MRGKNHHHHYHHYHRRYHHHLRGRQGTGRWVHERPELYEAEDSGFGLDLLPFIVSPGYESVEKTVVSVGAGRTGLSSGKVEDRRAKTKVGQERARLG
ncbi:hypothetical protein E2C01_089029 [Portunus trituberculatus]|uniref:Uncharacterized protein n=1 Tax=Portunus trituberculatus TaxID=210409 RepID=A0A5B7JNH1_PORTR|nr:hypothetical protein [Portunus trituberculatus]